MCIMEKTPAFAIGKLRIIHFNSNYSPVLIPGLALLPRGVLAIGYFFTLCYLFLGISIVADIFME